MKVGDIVEGVLDIEPNGSGYLILDNSDRYYIYKKNVYKGFDGDRVQAILIDGKAKDTLEARVVRIVSRKRYTYIGTVIDKTKNNGFLSVDSKRISQDFYLKKKDIVKYSLGDKLKVRIESWEDDKSPVCQVLGKIGEVGENSAEIESILFEYDLNPNFPKEVEEQSESIDWNIPESEIKKRKDYRNVNTITIDPLTAKDYDDAISLRKKGKNYEIGIHIADVTHYIQPDTALDKEAFKRGTSVYLVDRVIPMLPERLSNGVCSLRPNEDKLTFSVILEVNKNGDVLSSWIGRTIINSDYRYTYEEAQHMIEGGDDIGGFKEDILILDGISKKIRSKRKSVMFNRKEVKFVLDHDYKPIDVSVDESGQDSHQLIEELMLLANQAVGKKLFETGIGIYRNHDTPNADKLIELKNIASNCGFSLDLSDVRIGLNNLARDVKDTEFEEMLQTLSVRAMSKAEYGADNIGHYGLNFDFYSHFTSPIRRYSDVIAHRLISKIFNI